MLVNYLKADGADMNKAEALAETLAGEIQDGATYRNSELWDEYPELHKLEYTVNKSGQAKAELVKRYGITEELKAENQMLWVGKMNMCKARSEEIVKLELIYG